MPGEEPPPPPPRREDPPPPVIEVWVNHPTPLNFDEIFGTFGIAAAVGMLARAGGSLDGLHWWVYDRLGEADGVSWFDFQFVNRGLGGERASGDLIGMRSYAGNYLLRHYNAGIVGGSAPLQQEWGSPGDVAEAREKGWKHDHPPEDPEEPPPEIEYPCVWSVVRGGAGPEVVSGGISA